MNIITEIEYSDLRRNFFARHELQEINTSSVASDGTYCKDYVCANDAHWFEVIRPVNKTVEIEVCKVKTSVEIKLIETKTWNTEDSRNIFYYEKA